MKANILIFTAFLLLLAGCFCSCQKKENSIEYSSMVVGKWKLEFISDREQTIDYSKYNIVYEFKTNNVLTVTGKVNNTDHRILENGKHFYNVVIPESIDLLGDTRWRPELKIDTVLYRLTNGWMADNIPGLQIYDKADNPSFAAYVLYFSKIN